jgi:hypothetical protein
MSCSGRSAVQRGCLRGLPLGLLLGLTSAGLILGLTSAGLTSAGLTSAGLTSAGLTISAWTPVSGSSNSASLDSEMRDGAANLVAKKEEAGRRGRTGIAGGPPPVTVTVPACGGNEPNLAMPVEGLCAQAVSMCSDTTDPSDVMFWIYQGPPGVSAPVPGQWRLVGQACLHTGEVSERAVPAFTVEDFRRLPLPAGGVRIQPATLRTLVNVETNVYVDSRPVVLTTTLLGMPVRVRATPAGYTWTFGDGSRLRTTDPGGPFPRMSTTHVYRLPGRWLVTLVTSYTGEYSVAGGPWLPVDGEADVPSPAVTLTVVETRARLVDQPLP